MRWKVSLRPFVVDLLAPIVRHPITSVLTGAGLILGGIVELAEDLFSDFESTLAAYHGVIVLGVVFALRGLADLVEGVERLSKGGDAAWRKTAPSARSVEKAPNLSDTTS